MAKPPALFTPMQPIPAPDVRALRFPLLVSPKLDGMRVSITTQGPVTRGGELLPNEKMRAALSAPELQGLDGELLAGDPVAPDAVQRAIAVGMARHGRGPEAGTTFFTFDWFGAPEQPFAQRWSTAERIVREAAAPHVQAVAQFEVSSIDELVHVEASVLAMGFEGIVLRNPQAPYMFGRVPPASTAMMKLKRRTELVGEIVDVVRRRGALDALLVAHPDWPAPFEVPLHGEAKKLEGVALQGRRVRFSRHPGTWKSAPRAPQFIRLEGLPHEKPA